jgi:hypothetical protein
MISFKQFIENMSLFPGAMVTSSDTGSQAISTLGYTGRPNHLPDIDMAINDGMFKIPTVSKEGIVKRLNDKGKIIEAELTDGTKLFFSPTQYRAIKGETPLVPQQTKLKVIFQRQGKDFSLSASNIVDIEASFIGPDYLRPVYKIKKLTYKPVQL